MTATTHHKQRHRFRKLSLNLCQLTASHIALVVAHTPCEELDLRRNHFGDRGVEAIAAELRRPSCCIARLNLSKTCITSKGAIMLARALVRNRSLQSLYAMNNAIGERYV